MRNTLTVLATAAAVTALLGGCSTQDPGQATTAPPTSDTESSSEETSSSPSGPDLDYNSFIGNECSILKPDQVSQLGSFKEPTVDKTSAGPYCRWAAAEDGPSYRVTFLTNGSTIEEIRENAKGVPVYEQLEVDGYPAVSSDSAEGKQNCTTAVGTSKKGAILTQISVDRPSAPEYGKACEYTEKLAKIVLGNLRG